IHRHQKKASDHVPASVEVSPHTYLQDSNFIESWSKVIPNLDPPKTSSAFFTPCPAKKVDMVVVPATTGHMAVLPRHVPTIAELKPDVLSVHEVKDTASSLAEFTQKLGSATTDLEKAEAQIGVDVHSALNSGITG
ncbi:hypothetical protein Godav_012076, partial [Gossypium davidsonii]|nr:hypothetical protein [Gossypium davidsonii]